MQSIRLKTSRKLALVGLFGLTMGYFEAAIVEYLRMLYYPDGFAFPLADVPLRLLWIEVGREAASIAMLVVVGMLAGICFIDRFAGFMFGFGVWDITYYIFLKIFENWPPSLLTEDVLFLIPAVWVGPVWAPVGVSIALIWTAAIIWRRLDNDKHLNLTTTDWILEIGAGLLIIASFMLRAPDAIAKETLPTFPWWLWALGMALGLFVFARALRRNIL